MVANENALRARAASKAYEVLARIFACKPTKGSFAEFLQVTRLLDCDEFEAENIDVAAACAAFDARFIVPSSKLYVPLSENCILLARGDLMPTCGTNPPPHITWGPCSGPQSIHAAKCYRAAGFDPETIRKASPEAAALRDDALAVELAFMAYLTARQAKALDSELDLDAAAIAKWTREWQERFLRDHLLGWVGKATLALARTSNDLYARAALLTEAWCKFDTKRAANE